MASSLKGIENGRAAFAYGCAAKFYKDIGNDKEYKQYVKRLPMLIKTNGLGATFAFMLSKKKKKEGTYYKQIGENIREWLVKYKDYLLPVKMKEEITDYSKLVRIIVDIESSSYRALTLEVLSFLSWLRRFAEGLYQEKPSDDGAK